MMTASLPASRSDRALQRPPERGELALAADERRVEPPLEGGRRGRELAQAIRANGSCLPLISSSSSGSSSRGMVDEPGDELADDDLARLGSLLEPGGDADGFAR